MYSDIIYCVNFAYKSVLQNMQVLCEGTVKINWDFVPVIWKRDLHGISGKWNFLLLSFFINIIKLFYVKYSLRIVLSDRNFDISVTRNFYLQIFEF